MKYFERLEYKLSRGFKNSMAIELLQHHLGKLPYCEFKNIEYKDESYVSINQGDKIKYDFDENTGNISVLLETFDDLKKRYILLNLRKCGNEVTVITRTPKEDTTVFHIKHNVNKTVTSLSKRIKFYDREDEQLLESRFALFSDKGDLLDYDEQKADEYIKNTNYQIIRK